MAVKDQKHTEKYSIYNGDCIETMESLPSNSIDIAIYSPPFAELYNYSSSDRDLSNCVNHKMFFEHYDYVVRQISRLLKPGRICAIHCSDLRGSTPQNRYDFPGDLIRAHEKHGFHYFSKHTVWKEPLAMKVRTQVQFLKHKQIVEDSTKCASAGADFIVVMRKAGENKSPVEHPAGLKTYAGSDQPDPSLVLAFKDFGPEEDQKLNFLSHYIWRRYASSVWMDVREGRVLPFDKTQEEDEEKHVCPLQLDAIERLLVLYSNPGDVMLTPFCGVGSEVFTAVELGRKAVGMELKETYFRQSLRNVDRAASNVKYINEDLFTLAAGADKDEYTECNNGNETCKEDDEAEEN